MAIYDHEPVHEHEHESPGEFEPGCPCCELDEVSLQDTGRPWGARVIKLPVADPMPAQANGRAS